MHFVLNYKTVIFAVCIYALKTLHIEHIIIFMYHIRIETTTSAHVVSSLMDGR